jgi:hypothetical protein
LDLFDPLDDFLLEDLLALLHLGNLLVKGRVGLVACSLFLCSVSLVVGKLILERLAWRLSWDERGCLPTIKATYIIHGGASRHIYSLVFIALDHIFEMLFHS